MKIQTKEFQEILSKLQPGISQKKFVEQATHYIFTGKRICSYNDKISVSYPFVTDFQCSISSETFFQVVSKLTSKELELSFKNNQLNITTPKVKSGFTCLLEGEIFNLLNSLTIGEEWFELPEDFTKGIELCLFSASRDLTQKFLSSICIRNNRVESSDDVRISRYTMKGSVPVGFLLPISSAKELLRYTITHYSLLNSWIHFKLSSGGIFSSRVILEEYPETSSFFIVKGINVKLPPELLTAVEMVSILSEGDFDLDKRINIKVEKGTIICRSSNSSGWIEKKIPSSYQGEEISFVINPYFFKQILEKSTEVLVSEDRVLFTSDSFSHILALQI